MFSPHKKKDMWYIDKAPNSYTRKVITRFSDSFTTRFLKLLFEADL